MDEAAVPAAAPPRHTEAHAKHDGPSLHDNEATPNPDVLVCRICRGEGSLEEPLFYPCRCSGSIKYVHQDCLMEWLSHSQKKYCELCKTSFRFTKLYAPDMPQSVPYRVFVHHVLRYCIRHTLVWARAILAISVWAIVLPWLMRTGWSILFSFSDSGFWLGSSPANATESTGALSDMATTLGWISGTDTCPASPLLAARATPVATAEALLLNSALGQKTAEYILRKVLEAWSGEPVQTVNTDATGPLLNETTRPMPTPSSLLSDVQFFSNMTSNPSINQLVTKTVEGQIITILVIVCFILVILVRDYVVQQQPGFEIQIPEARPAANGVGELPEVPWVNEADDSEGSVPDDEDLDESDVEILQQASSARHVRNDDIGIEPFPPPRQERNGSESTASAFHEEDVASPSEAFVQDAFRRAGGDEARFVRIMRNETREHLAGGDDRGRFDQPFSEDADTVLSSNESTTTFDHFQVDGDYHADTVKKGNEPCQPGPSGTQEDLSTPLPEHTDSFPPRQRAHSDGPQPSLNANPLGSNNWSFSNLPTPRDQSEVESSFDFWGGRVKPSSNEAIDGDSRPTTPPSGAPKEVGSPDSAWTSVNYGQSDDDDHFANAGTHAQSNPVRGVVAETEDEGTHQVHARLDVPEQEVVGEILPPTPEEPGQLLDDNGMLARVVDGVQDLMWGGLDEEQMIDLGPAHVDEEDVADEWEDEFLDPRDAPHDDVAAPPVEIADDAALDEEAIEDMEDFEGVMELLGMRGPIGGLVQNAIFCAFLVCGGIMLCVFFPYNVGKISLWAAAHPMRLVRMAFECLKLLQDMVISLAGFVLYFCVNIVDMVTSVFGGSVAQHILALRKSSWGLWTGAAKRVCGSLFLGLPLQLSSYDVRNFSISSHEALMTIKSAITSTASSIFGGIWTVLAGNINLAWIANTTTNSFNAAGNLSQALKDPSYWVIDFGEVERPLQEFTMFNAALAYWSSSDRFWAIVSGYATMFVFGAVILRRGSFVPRGSALEPYEAGLLDLLQQASGIIKVILIISIEMLVFPLYCGLLLDAALLPLFGGATFQSRISWTCRYPLTSIFVHWFVGTGYMFHFALFVSMCRKIMRPGVLYFIRDPDDPDFHPVRDVLERNLTTQLRKIMFSAFVYGALVIVCLGGVVWGLSWTMPHVLPIHYSSNEPVLEFPVDLLFYNFLMPLAVKFFKPSDGLHTMYTWWFRKCARGLCLTFFLFGERRIDEEGTLHLEAGSPHHAAPWYKKIFLELQKLTVIPKTWSDVFEGGDAKPKSPLSARKLLSFRLRKEKLVQTEQLTPNGRLVRAPASDRVKIPKGKKVFITVNENNKPQEGQLIQPSDRSLYNSDLYQVVYVPPHFRARIFLFILYIWLFAAVTGVGFTIGPLLLGRAIFDSLLPVHVKTNDIYAFSIGIYILGTVGYSVFHARYLWAAAKSRINHARGNTTPRDLASSTLYGLKLFYTYFVLLIVYPLLLSTLMELYVAMPLHTYLNPPTTGNADDQIGTGRHSVRIMQAWTLGLLYMKLSTKVITSVYRRSRLGVAVRSVLMRGYLDPDVRLLTRAFVVPTILIAAIAIFLPPLSLKFWSGVLSGQTRGTPSVVMYRASYPVFGLLTLATRHAAVAVLTLKQWSARVRDEAYLIGERLHNFGSSGSRADHHASQTGRGHGTVVQVEG